MSMTFLNQQSMLSRLLGDSNTGSDDMWPAADRKFEINRGELQFARDSKALLGYATGTLAGASLSIPADWLETYHLVVDDEVITNDREIALADWERYVNNGLVYFYYWVDASGTRLMNFTTTSAATYKLWYFRKPTTDLSADDDESVYQDEYREASVYYAASNLLEQIGKTQLADRYRAKYQYFADKAKTETEKLYVNKEYARPDIMGTEQFDRDIQGIGQVNG